MKTLTLHKLSEPALEALGARIAQSLFPGAFLALLPGRLPQRAASGM